MKAKKILSLCLAAAVIIGMVGCQSKGNDETAQSGNDTQTETPAETPAEKVTLKIGQANFAAHGTKAFAVVTTVVSGDEIVSAYIDEFQYMSADTSTGVPNSEGMADNVIEGKVLGSKRENNETYSKNMAEKAGSTVEIATNFDVIQDFVKGKKISELEELVGKSAEEVVDAVTGATLADTTGYIQAVLEAAKQADSTTGVEFDGNVEDLTLAQTYSAAHGTKSFTITSVLVNGDEVVLAYIDELQYMAVDTTTGVANSDADLAENYAEGKVLGSKRANAESYSKNMAEKAGSTVAIDANFDAIQEFVEGKKISELEEVTGKTAEEVIDAVSGCTLADTTGYITAVIEAAKAAK